MAVRGRWPLMLRTGWVGNDGKIRRAVAVAENSYPFVSGQGDCPSLPDHHLTHDLPDSPSGCVVA